MNAAINRPLLRAAVFALLFALLGAVQPLAAKTTLGTPLLSLGNETQTTIDVTFTAVAPGGAPSGFTIQWMTQADYLANGFSSTLPLGCDASFSGNASGSSYSLAPGQSIVVTVGALPASDGHGESSVCPGPLVCGTAYVFRAFAHGDNVWGKSDFTGIIADSTLPCSTGCTLTQGYWKTHGPIPVGNNLNTWPVAVLTNGLTLGTVPYSALQLLAILNQKPMGNALISLAHQLIAVRLSIANGADASSIAGAIAAADLLIGSLVVPPVGAGTLDPSTLIDGVTGTLDDWLNANDCSNPTP